MNEFSHIALASAELVLPFWSGHGLLSHRHYVMTVLEANSWQSTSLGSSRASRDIGFAYQQQVVSANPVELQLGHLYHFESILSPSVDRVFFLSCPYSSALFPFPPSLFFRNLQIQFRTAFSMVFSAYSWYSGSKPPMSQTFIYSLKQTFRQDA